MKSFYCVSAILLAAAALSAAEVAGIAVSEGKPSDADLAATVTIAIGGFQALIAKAMQ